MSIRAELACSLLTAANQRWLSVRLDCTGSLLSFAVAIMAAKGGSGLDGAQVGLVLSYMTTLVQVRPGSDVTRHSQITDKSFRLHAKKQFGMFFRQVRLASSYH